MTGPFMVEIVFCRVTRRGRKKRAGMNKAGKENMRNDGPSQSFIPPDNMVKLTLDLSDNGPVFSAGHNFGDMVDAGLADARRLFEVCTAMMNTITDVRVKPFTGITEPMASGSPRP